MFDRFGFYSELKLLMETLGYSQALNLTFSMQILQNKIVYLNPH